MDKAELALDIAENQTTGELAIAITIVGHAGIFLTPEQAKDFNMRLIEAIAYIKANQQLKEVPDNVVSFPPVKH